MELLLKSLESALRYLGNFTASSFVALEQFCRSKSIM